MGHSRVIGRLSVVGGLALIGAGGVVYAEGGVVGPRAEPWYDPVPLLVSLRREARVGLTHALGVEHPEDVTLYDLDLSYDASAATYTLNEDVWFTNTTKAPLPDLVLRLYANAAPPDSGPQVRFVSGSCVSAPACTMGMATPSAIRVQPSAPIPPGGRLHARLILHGTLTRIDPSRTNFMAQSLEGMKSVFGGGSNGGDYGLLAVGDGIVSLANFYAVLARREPGGWETAEASKLGDLGSDEMAHFRARIELPSQAKVAVTGAVTGDSEVQSPGGAPDHREVKVSAAAIRDFALLFGDGLEVSSRDVHGVRVRSYYLAADRAAGSRVLDVAAHALEDFERRFGPYPYTEYGVSEAAIVGGAGGVEFSGLVTAASMFYRPMNAAGPGSGGANDPMAAIMAQLGALGGGMTEGMLEFVVAHETAHQWWHGLVGSDSRDHPYQDEALAQYSSILYLEDRYGAARAEKDGDANVKMNYQSMRALGKPDAPADAPVESFSSSIQYAGIVYGKAPYFYRAVRSEIGDAAFFAALRSYVTRYRFGVAPGRALVDAFAAAAGQAKIRPLESRWLDETHGDEDLGTLDLNAMLGGLMGNQGAAGALGGAAGMGDLEQVMKMLQGASGSLGGGAPGTPGATPSTGDPDVQELLKMFSK